MENTFLKNNKESTRKTQFMSVDEYGLPFKGSSGYSGGMNGLMVPSNPDIFKTKMKIPEDSKPFFKANTIVRPDNLDHEPYLNSFKEDFRNIANTNYNNYAVAGTRSDLYSYDINFNKQVRQIKPETDLLWSASGEVINTIDGKREPNFLNTSIGNYATVTTDDGKSFYSNTPVKETPGMRGTTINNGMGGVIREGFSDTPKINIDDFPKISKPGDRMLMKMTIPQHGRPF